MLTPELVARIKKLKVADLADGCRLLGVRAPTANPSLRPAVPYRGLVGTAVTHRIFIGSGERDYGEQATEVYMQGRSVPYAVVVQRNAVPDFTSIGSGGAYVARAHGYVGWVTSGPMRDTDEMPSREGFALYGTSIVPSGRDVQQVPAGQSIQFEFGATFEVAGMTVALGDILVGDNDGMIALKPADVEAVLVEAEKIFDSEAEIYRQLDQGLNMRQIMEAQRAAARQK
jgi:regulator of RNase E activity RraA